ncbi:hypothetical protein QBZ16_003811 [Prototheca wickerhamii]|uniref:Uncharacterized protein n=1 Tax=Prototheca wickerhamii TaxID=3111 RepID=A0AAD9MLD4_PROWI|nr:hypothetical protein QBZ16_003811 [Prototheca wickerhamii]
MDPAEVGTPVARTGGRSFSETDETIKPADGTPSSPPSVRESETDSSGSSLAAVDVSPRTSAARCLELFEELPQNDQEEAHESLSEGPKALAEIDIPAQVEDDTEISPSLASLVVGESASEVAKRSLLSFYATLESQQAPHEFSFAKPRATSGSTKPVRATRVSRGATVVAGLVLLAFVAGAALTLASPASTTLFPRALLPSLRAWPGKSVPWRSWVELGQHRISAQATALRTTLSEWTRASVALTEGWGQAAALQASRERVMLESALSGARAVAERFTARMRALAETMHAIPSAIRAPAAQRAPPSAPRRLLGLLGSAPSALPARLQERSKVLLQSLEKAVTGGARERAAAKRRPELDAAEEAWQFHDPMVPPSAQAALAGVLGVPPPVAATEKSQEKTLLAADHEAVAQSVAATGESAIPSLALPHVALIGAVLASVTGVLLRRALGRPAVPEPSLLEAEPQNDAAHELGRRNLHLHTPCVGGRSRAIAALESSPAASETASGMTAQRTRSLVAQADSGFTPSVRTRSMARRTTVSSS